MGVERPDRREGFTADLPPWQEVKDAEEWEGLLVGNGLSRAVWDGFSYSSLYETARLWIDHPLTSEDQALFGAFATENFELVLSALTEAERVDQALERDPAPLRARYESVRRGLIEAVHAVHVPWATASADQADPDDEEDDRESRLGRILDALHEYDRVFTTNYDLLLYWAVMEQEPPQIRDFFWGPGCVFDPRDVDVWTGTTALFFLHGGLHLLRLSTGEARKRTNTQRNLLEVFAAPPSYDPDALPLLITEGTSEQKLASIRSSEYLAFAYRSFEEFAEPLVVFGHSLSDRDAHVVNAMSGWGDRPIAVSIRPSHPADEIRSRKADVVGKLPNADLIFFNSETHPLGDPELTAG